MKAKIIYALTILLIYELQIEALAQDISISDFRIPETKYQRLTGSLSAGWDKNDYSNNDVTYSFSNSSRHSNFQSELNYNYVNFNEDNSLEINMRLSGQAFSQSNENNGSASASLSHSSASWTDYRLNIRPDIRYSSYLIPDNWFWYIEGSGQYSFSQYTDEYNSTYSDGYYVHDTTFQKNNTWSASLGGGLGYGKLRDGSPVYAVIRILDKLSEDSAITRSLTKNEVLQIVEIFAKRIEYMYSQERYIKYFIEDIFDQLQKMGVLKENAAAAYSVLRAVEVLSERIEPRLFGWRAMVGVQRRYSEDIGVRNRSEISSQTYDHIWDFHDYVSLNLDYGYPISLNLQVNSNFSIDIPRIDCQRKIGFKYELAWTYQIGEKIGAVISSSAYKTNTPLHDENDFLRTIQYKAGITFRFFIENNVNLALNCGYLEEYRYHYTLLSPTNYMSKTPTVSLGVNYRFF